MPSELPAPLYCTVQIAALSHSQALRAWFCLFFCFYAYWWLLFFNVVFICLIFKKQLFLFEYIRLMQIQMDPVAFKLDSSVND